MENYSNPVQAVLLSDGMTAPSLWYESVGHLTRQIPHTTNVLAESKGSMETVVEESIYKYHPLLCDKL